MRGPSLRSLARLSVQQVGVSLRPLARHRPRPTLGESSENPALDSSSVSGGADDRRSPSARDRVARSSRTIRAPVTTAVSNTYTPTSISHGCLNSKGTAGPAVRVVSLGVVLAPTSGRSRMRPVPPPLADEPLPLELRGVFLAIPPWCEHAPLPDEPEMAPSAHRVVMPVARRSDMTTRVPTGATGSHSRSGFL